MASRFVNNYRGEMSILSITFATCEQYSQKLRDIYTLRFQMCRHCQRYDVEGIPQNELTQLQHPWHGISATLPSICPMSTQFYGNKYCVPNMVKLVT
jgi:hypothetical protein